MRSRSGTQAARPLTATRTQDDPRPRYRLIPIARSVRDISFAELGSVSDNGRVDSPWIPIDHPSLIAGDRGPPPGRARAETAIARINAILGRLLADNTPPIILHLVEADFDEVREVLHQQPAGFTLDANADGGTRIYQISVVLTGRVASFIEFKTTDPADNQERPAFVRLDAPQEVTLEPPPQVTPDGRIGGYGHGGYGRGSFGVGEPANFDPSVPPGTPNREEAVGNVLTGTEVADLGNTAFPVLDSNGDPIFDSGSRSSIASGSMGGPVRVGAVQGRAVGGPPPEVPEPDPALIEPEWVDGRLTLPKRVPANDLGDNAVLSLKAAVRAEFESFIAALAQSGTNFHPAARMAIEDIPELLSGATDQVHVFQMGHAVEQLEALQSVVDEELPDALSVRYSTLVGQFRRLVERFPRWRALMSRAQAEPLTDEQDEQAVHLARELATVLSPDAAGEVVDADIPEALSALADAAEAASGLERTLLNFDLVASIKQIVTLLMQPVVYCWREVSSGALTEIKALPRKFGKGAVNWSFTTVVAIAGLHVGAGPLAVVAAHLATAYPTLSWLPSVIEFLKFVAALPKG